MAHSRKSKPNNLIDCTKELLSKFIKQNNHVIAALSGGVDSVVLLHILSMLSGPMQFKLSAVHVDHGISQNASHWCKFCCNFCSKLSIPITITHLKIEKTPGVSLEAAAREARYHVFNRLQADYIVLGQHLDDQAETLMLQLLRGAGIKGLAAMPVIRKQQSDTAPLILRPLLETSRNCIERYAREKKLDWVTDESNKNITYNRNFLRHEIFPILGKRYPDYQTTISRASQHLAEASQLLDELAEIDEKNYMVSGKLPITHLLELTIPRLKNLLRYIFSQHGIKLPSTAKLTDIVRQLSTANSDTKLHISVGHAEMRCYKGNIHIFTSNKSLPENKILSIWHGEKKLILKQPSGSINFLDKKNIGISTKKLAGEQVTVRLRSGGERFRPDCKRPRRRLKHLMQEALIPPWERDSLPLLFSGNHLIWVPGIGISCEFQAHHGETGLSPIWQPARLK